MPNLRRSLNQCHTVITVHVAGMLLDAPTSDSLIKLPVCKPAIKFPIPIKKEDSFHSRFPGVSSLMLPEDCDHPVLKTPPPELPCRKAPFG